MGKMKQQITENEENLFLKTAQVPVVTLTLCGPENLKGLLANTEDQMKCHMMRHLNRVCTVC